MSEDNKETEKKRGRGAPKGRRPRIWVCSGVVNDNLVTKSYEVHDRDPDPDSKGSFPKEDAMGDFQIEFGVEPEIVLGPYFQDKSITASKSESSKKRLTIDRANINDYLDKLELKRYNAVYGPWTGLANHITGHPEKIFFAPLAPLEEGSKKPVPAAGLVDRELIEITGEENEEAVEN